MTTSKEGAVCLIYEASVVLVEEDSGLSKLLRNGNLKVSDLKQKQHTITMIFSTVEGEEVFSYFVDCKNKMVLEPVVPESEKMKGGIFFNLFGKAA